MSKWKNEWTHEYGITFQYYPKLHVTKHSSHISKVLFSWVHPKFVNIFPFQYFLSSLRLVTPSSFISAKILPLKWHFYLRQEPDTKWLLYQSWRTAVSLPLHHPSPTCLFLISSSFSSPRHQPVWLEAYLGLWHPVFPSLAPWICDVPAILWFHSSCFGISANHLYSRLKLALLSCHLLNPSVPVSQPCQQPAGNPVESAGHPEQNDDLSFRNMITCHLFHGALTAVEGGSWFMTWHVSWPKDYFFRF